MAVISIFSYFLLKYHVSHAGQAIVALSKHEFIESARSLLVIGVGTVMRGSYPLELSMNLIKSFSKT